MDDIEDSEYVASEHDRLISAVTKLDKTQFITEPTRNEPTNLNSEFSLVKNAPKLNLGNVVKVLGDSTRHVKFGKKLKQSQDKSKVLQKPLEKPQAERIKRSTGYEQTKEKLGRWDPIVAKSRTANYTAFPLRHTSSKMEPTHEFISKFELKSALEKELDEIDPPPEPEVEDVDEQVYPMTYEEMLEHRQNSAKIRAQQSYNAAKAKRQSKIKSKKYHRILKKERLKQQLKEFEELQMTDPEEALKRLESLEKARALERHTLRHKNTGKWAKSKLIRAKYDKETRQELAEQLAVSRGLTKKTNVDESSDDDNDIDHIPDMTLAQDPMNPWMLKRSDKSNVDAEFDFGYKKYVNEKMFKRKVDSDSDSEAEQNQDQGMENRIGLEQGNNLDMLVLKNSINKIGHSQNTEDEDSDDNQLPNPIKKPSYNKDKGIKGIESKKLKRSIKTSPTSKKVQTKLVATSSWTVESVTEEASPDNKTKANSGSGIIDAFDTLQDEVENKVAKKIKELKSNIEKLEHRPKEARSTKRKEKKEERDNLEYLALKKQKIRPVIDEELIETGAKTPENNTIENKPLSKILNTIEAASSVSTESNIDPNRFIEVKPKFLNSVVPEGENDYDQLDDEEQVVPKVNIEEVFEEDDVVASFRQEKEDEINKDKPEVDLGLPGWGSWGGKGVKAPKRKRNRFITKLAPKIPRRDENKGDIIIKEFKDPKLAVHKVTDVPFPFTSVKEYEASIRAPLGNTFIPEKAHQKLIRPNVITKAGAIINPMDEGELLDKRSHIYKNESVLKLLAKK